MKHDDFFSTRDLKDLVKAIFSALELFDAKHLAHFNIKPSNILLHSTQQEDVYKLADYGFESLDKRTERIYGAPELHEDAGGFGHNEFL